MTGLIREHALRRTCSRCGAAPGERCKSKFGRYTSEHVARVNAALPDVRREREKRQIQSLAQRVFNGPAGEKMFVRKGTLQMVFRRLAELDHTLVREPES